MNIRPILILLFLLPANLAVSQNASEGDSIWSAADEMTSLYENTQQYATESVAWDQSSWGSGLAAGVDFLSIRPRFSEAVAFAEGTQPAPFTYDISGRPLRFDYQGALRAFVDAPIGCDAMRFSYLHSNSDVNVDGSVAGGGQFIVDPFGNVVGTVVVIDPSDARFLTPVTGGDAIRTEASVQANVFDVDYQKTLDWTDWSVRFDGGIRIAEISQFYSSNTTLAGAPVSRGTFSAEFKGLGPRLGVEANRYLASGRWSLLASTHASLLVGEFNTTFSNVVPAFALTANQSNGQTRAIPVIETELGATGQLTESLTISAGWLFHAWFDLGTSGGNFGGFFTGADDANLMMFDGLFARLEWRR